MSKKKSYERPMFEQIQRLAKRSVTTFHLDFGFLIEDPFSGDPMKRWAKPTECGVLSRLNLTQRDVEPCEVFLT